MSSRNFTPLGTHLATEFYGSGSYKAMLVSSIPDETALDTWDFANDVTNEIAATGGYTAGGFAVTPTVGAVDTVNNRVPVTFTVASPTYTDSTISAVGAIIYKDSGVAGTSPIAHYVDFGGTIASTNGNFTVTFSTPFYINA